MLKIDYYSDILCVWAWVAQRRIEELNERFGDQVEWCFHYMDVFGDTAGKMKSQWSDRGGIEGFASHVSESAAHFHELKINDSLWREVQPKTSANAHLILKAVELEHGVLLANRFSKTLREAFFLEAVDIGEMSVLYHLSDIAKLNTEKIKQFISDGSAVAVLMSDYQKSRNLNIKGSPSYVLDGGRQTLYGNVGYRVLQANVEELLKQPENDASWC